MKISYISMQFPVPSETFASNDILELQKQNIDVDIYTLKNKCKNYRELVEERKLNDLDIYPTSRKEILIGLLEILKNFTLFLSLLLWIIKSDYKKPVFILKTIFFIPSAFYILKCLEKRKPDLIHLFWGHYPSIVAYLIKKRLKNVKVSIFLGAYDLSYALGISKKVCNFADFIFTHTKINLESFEKLGIDKNRINIVYRGTNINEIGKTNEKECNSLCTGGRLIAAKNFDRVIDVFNEYQKVIKESKLYIFGDGPEKNNLIEKVNKLGLEDKVIFTGFVSQQEVSEIVSKSEFFLFFSTKRGERLPNVLKEAMVNQCIPISTLTPGIDELIKNKENGFILDNFDIAEVTDLLLNVDDKNKIKMKSNAKNYIIDNFNISQCMERYITIWKTKVKI